MTVGITKPFLSVILKMRGWDLTKCPQQKYCICFQVSIVIYGDAHLTPHGSSELK